MWKIISVGVLILAYNLFFFPFLVPIPGHVDFVLFEVIVLVAGWLCYRPKRGAKHTRFALIASIMAIGGSILALFDANPVSATILGLIAFGLTVTTLYLLLLQQDQFGGIAEIVSIPFRLMAAWIIRFFHPDPEWGKWKVMRGIIIAIPLMVVLLALLSSADPIFGKLVGNLFKLPQDLFRRIFFSGVLLIGLTPLASSAITARYRSPARSSQWQRYSVEMITIVGLVVIVLGAFLVIQFRYLFATVPETQLKQFGINTYSEYVRRGFVEMILVTCIGYGVAALGYVVRLKRIGLFLLAELGLFIASIFRRVYLYQLFHGLTRSRIFGSVFVIYLFGLLVLLTLRYLLDLKKPWYLYELGIGILLVVMVSLIKPDVIIARFDPPTVNHEIDYVYLAGLSADALPAWVAGFNQAESIMATVPDPRSTPSAEVVRPIIYASDATNELFGQYRYMIALYGTKDEFVRFDGAGNATKVFEMYQKRGILDKNMADAIAYKQLMQSIDPMKLKKLQIDLQNYLEELPSGYHDIPLDRSYSSPL